VSSNGYPRSTRIVGYGHYAPEGVLTNEDLSRIVDTSDEWITSRTGIKERRILADGEAASDLALKACQQALQNAGVDAETIDAIVVGTISGDMVFPPTACLLQEALGARRAASFDVAAACSGFVYSLGTADSFIRVGSWDRALVVGVEALTRFVDFEDRSTCVLFGDGAGAVVVEHGREGEGILATSLHSNGSLADLLWVPAGGSRRPSSEETVRAREHYIRMKGDGVFRYAVRAMADSSRRVLQLSGHVLDEVKLFIPHQANVRIIESIRDRLHMDPERVYINLDRYGNTSSATIPIALSEARGKGLFGPGDLVLISAFGGGFTWGSILFRA
jgi:3-oxoacyl-[acyl-carrier-protein] synthase-3